MRPLLILGGALAYWAAATAIPFGVTHELSEGCYWMDKPVWNRLGLANGEPSFHDNIARAACFNRRGGYGVEVNNVLPAFPDRATLVALRGDK